MGALRWPPSEFWSATPHDLFDAMDGFALARGGKSASVAKEAYADWLAKEFGDDDDDGT